ncbi:hypothetical protein, partial [Planobispora longispora]|uniref:hypothetical protein n=1 Tax=Planobispora longispora TaxID=28887 RepID=UPI0035EA9DF0
GVGGLRPARLPIPATNAIDHVLTRPHFRRLHQTRTLPADVPRKSSWQSADQRCGLTGQSAGQEVR